MRDLPRELSALSITTRELQLSKEIQVRQKTSAIRATRPSRHSVVEDADSVQVPPRSGAWAWLLLGPYALQRLSIEQTY